MPLCQLYRGSIAGRGRLGYGKAEYEGLGWSGRLRGHLPGLREVMLVVASGLCGRGIPGSVDKSVVEVDDEGGQLMTAVAEASTV